MSIAVLTGASSGLGREFALRIKDRFPDIDEIWLVARRADRLEALAKEIGCGRIVAVDLTREEGLSALKNLLDAEKPSLRLLINNAGCGYLGAFAQTDMPEQEAMVRLNVLALTQLTRIALDHMTEGGRIINISSIASFVPNANMAVYSSTKAYVQSFSRALAYELKSRHITVTAVCPGPMSTEFLEVGRITGHSKAFSALPYCSAPSVAEKALAACAAGKTVYTPKGFYKLYRVLSHLLPKSWLIPMAKT